MSYIIDIIGQFVELKKKTETEYSCKCPFHDDKTASLFVNEEKGVFNCFGCNTCGDEITFISKFENLDFKKSLTRVCSLLGISEDTYKKEKDINANTVAVKKENTVEPLPKSFVMDFMASTGFEFRGYRGIRDDIRRFFGHLAKLDNTGKVTAIYYPETDNNNRLVGYKCRNHPKDFSYGKVGHVGSKNQLAGQVKFKGTHKYVLIVGGECYTPDTEILTEKGWIGISQIPEDTRVMQVTNGIGEFVMPIAKVKKEFDGELLNYKSSQIDLLVTPNHKMVSLSGNGKEYTHTAIDLPKSKAHLFRKNVISISDKLDYDKLTDDQLKFIVAYSADSKVDTRKSGKRVAHFSFIKERKIQRLNKLLLDIGMTYTSYDKGGRSWKCNRKYHTFNVTLENWVPVKGIPVDWIHNLSLRQKKLVLDELILWDGNFVKNRNAFEFSSKNLDEVEVVQCLALTSGYHARIRKRTNKLGEWYVVKVSCGNNTASYQSVVYEKVKYSGLVYCVTVPSGQILVRRNGKALVCGSCDMAAAYQMLVDSKKDADFAPIPVVSPTIGENCAKQVAAQYDWFDKFDNIIIGLDNDAAGIAASKKLVEVLPKDKVRIATWTDKDPNKMLLNGMQKQFVRDFYSAKEVVSSGIYSSVDSIAGVDDFLTAKRISLPPHMHRVQTYLNGGIRSTGGIVNIIADTSTGKTLISDGLFLHWIFNSHIVPTIISLERTKEELLIDLESLYLKKNLLWFKDGDEAVNYRHIPEVVRLREELYTNDNGEPRFYIIDERDATIEGLKTQMERASIKYGSNLFIIDPLTDFLRSQGLEVQDEFLMWEKQQKKKGKVFINILHTRKPPSDKDGKPRFVTEYDALGSGTFVQSADINIVLNRDKMAADDIERNTTIIDIPKCRGGRTGRVEGGLLFDPKTRQQVDLLDWQNSDGYLTSDDTELPQETTPNF